MESYYEIINNLILVINKKITDIDIHYIYI
jgi:hypothetical protein